jgi:nucleotide-binding universal stress UspA family protein
MHVLVATDGSLDTARTAKIVARLADETGRVTVFTAVEVPRQILHDLRSASAVEMDTTGIDVEYRRERAGDATPDSWIGDDAFIELYVKRVVETRTAELVAELKAAGVEVTAVGVEGENAARCVLDAVSEHNPDLLCIGTHGVGLFEGRLGSLSTKLARLAPCPVLLLR